MTNSIHTGDLVTIKTYLHLRDMCNYDIIRVKNDVILMILDIIKKYDYFYIYFLHQNGKTYYDVYSTVEHIAVNLIKISE